MQISHLLRQSLLSIGLDTNIQTFFSHFNNVFHIASSHLWKWQMLETMSFKYMLFWKLLYFHNINVDNFWHTFQLPLEKILAQGIQNRLIFKSKIRDILRYLEDLSRYFRKTFGICRHFFENFLQHI